MKSRGSEDGLSHRECLRSRKSEDALSQKTSPTHPYKAVRPPRGGCPVERGAAARLLLAELAAAPRVEPKRQAQQGAAE
eukprot:996784-Prymnesium_polylepis.1